MRNIDALINHCNIAMIEKLKENSHKPGFEMEIKEAIDLLNKENIELGMAFSIYTLIEKMPQTSNSDRIKALKEIRREAADNSNFSGMIIYNCDLEIERLERESEEQ
jgi:hypothetical protein